MTVIEMQVLSVIRSSLPEIAKALQRIADALENPKGKEKEDHDNS